MFCQLIGRFPRSKPSVGFNICSHTKWNKHLPEFKLQLEIETKKKKSNLF